MSLLQHEHHPAGDGIGDGDNEREEQVGQPALLAGRTEINQQQEHHVDNEEKGEDGAEPLGHFHVNSRDFIHYSEYPLEDGDEVSPLCAKEPPQTGEDVVVGEERHPDDGEVDAEGRQNIKIGEGEGVLVDVGLSGTGVFPEVDNVEGDGHSDDDVENPKAVEVHQ